MHPILADRRQLGLYLLGYLPISLVLIIALGQHGAWMSAVVFCLPLTLVYAFIGLSAYYLCVAFPIRSNARTWLAVPAHLSASATAAALGLGIAWLWSALLRSLNLGLNPDPYMRQPWLLFLIGVLLFGLAIAVHYVLIASYDSSRLERRALESGLLAREAELKALRAQLNPHFLFNSLNSISALTVADPSAARTMCLQLADFLRDTLRLGATQRISLREELRIIQRYLSIEQVRLGTRLAVRCSVSEVSQRAWIPALLLQPLAENAVMHGIAHLLEGGTIAIDAETDQRTLRVTVSNPSDPQRPRGHGPGVGLSLVRQRLQSQYGGAGQLLTREEEGQFSAIVSLPWEAGES